MLAVAPSSARRYKACGSFSPPAVRIDGLDPSGGLASTVVMPRFFSDPGVQKSPKRVDTSSPAADAQSAAAGAGTFLRPTPPRSPREGTRAALGFRHRRWHSFSGFQEHPGECGVHGILKESLAGAYDGSPGDIGYPPRVARPSSVAATVAAAATSAADAVSSSLSATPAVTVHYSVPPAAAAASVVPPAAAAAISPHPAEATRPRSQTHGSETMARRDQQPFGSETTWPRSQSHGSETLVRRRQARHRRTRSVEAVMEYSNVAGQNNTTMNQSCIMKQVTAMTLSSSPPFPRAYTAVQSPHGLRAAYSAGKQSQRIAGTCSLKSPRGALSSASSASSSPSKPVSPPPLSPPLSPPPLAPPPLSRPPLSPPPLSLLSPSKPISLPSPSKPTKPTSRSSGSMPVAGLLASGRYSIPDSFMQLNSKATSSSKATSTKAAVGGGAASAACTSGDLKGTFVVQATSGSGMTISSMGNGKSLASGIPSQAIAIPAGSTSDASTLSSSQSPKNKRRVRFNKMVQVRTFFD